MSKKVSETSTTRTIRLEKQTYKHLADVCKYFGVTPNTVLTILLDDAFIGQAPQSIMDARGARQFYKALNERVETNTYLFNG